MLHSIIVYVPGYLVSVTKSLKLHVGLVDSENNLILRLSQLDPIPNSRT